MTSAFKRYRRAAVLLAMAMTILVPVVSSADTYIVSNGPLVPPEVPGMGPGSVDNSTAAAPVTGLPIQNGTFRPSAGAMADFLGQNPAGTWVLELSDNGAQDPLCFGSAALHVATMVKTYAITGFVTHNGTGLEGVTIAGLTGQDALGPG